MNFHNVEKKTFIRELKPIALMIPSFQVNSKASDLLSTNDSILKFKTENSCIWVIDVGSPDSKSLITPKDYSSVNFVFTSFTPTSWESTSRKNFLKN